MVTALEKLERQAGRGRGPERKVTPAASNHLPGKPTDDQAEGRPPLPPGVPRIVKMKRSITGRGGLLRKGLTYDVIGGDHHGNVVVELNGYETGLDADDYEPVDQAAAETKPAAGETNGHTGETPSNGRGRKHRVDESHQATSLRGEISALPAIDVPLAELERHPDNRRPTEAAVASMAASLQAEGLLEALVVRRLKPGRLQIISGETRQLAAKQRGYKLIKAKVIECDDARALQLLAIYNAERKDLNPIEKAKLIERLCKPTAEGGGGLTREAAAKIYGMESGGAASNLVRLLELPKVWQDRVATGELNQSYARELLVIAHAPRLMKHAEESWKQAHGKNCSHWERAQWLARESLADLIESIIRNETRSIDPKKKQHYSGNHGSDWWSGDFPILFELTDDVRKKLDIVTLKVAGKELELATDTVAFDRLQIPLARAAALKKRKGKASAASDRDEKSAAKKKALTPAQQKAKAKLQAEQLANRIRAWRHEWLKELVAHELVGDASMLDKFVTAVILATGGRVMQELAACMQESLPKGIVFDFGDLGEAWAIAKRVETQDGDEGQYDLLRASVIKLLRLEDRDPKCPLVPFALVDGLAAELQVDLAKAWADVVKGGDDLARFESFLLLHTGEQLDELNAANKWGFYLEGKGKSAKIDIMKTTAKHLPLPKSITPIAAAAAGKRKRGRK